MERFKIVVAPILQATAECSFLSDEFRYRPLIRVENHMRATKERKDLSGLAVSDFCIPHLGGPANMHRFGRAFDSTLASCTQMIDFELYSGELACVFWEIDRAAVSRAGVRKGNNASGMQEAGRCHK